MLLVKYFIERRFVQFYCLLSAVDNLFMIRLCKAHSEALSVPSGQLSPQCGDNPFATGTPFTNQNVLAESSTDLPVQQDEPHVEGCGGLATRAVDQGSHVVEQRSGPAFW